MSVEPMGVQEPEAAFDPETELSPHDPHAEALARQRGMGEEEIAMVKAGLKAVKEGRTRPSSAVFADLDKTYGW